MDSLRLADPSSPPLSRPPHIPGNERADWARHGLIVVLASTAYQLFLLVLPSSWYPMSLQQRQHHRTRGLMMPQELTPNLITSRSSLPPSSLYAQFLAWDWDPKPKLGPRIKSAPKRSSNSVPHVLHKSGMDSGTPRPPVTVARPV